MFHTSSSLSKYSYIHSIFLKKAYEVEIHRFLTTHNGLHTTICTSSNKLVIRSLWPMNGVLIIYRKVSQASFYHNRNTPKFHQVWRFFMFSFHYILNGDVTT